MKTKNENNTNPSKSRKKQRTVLVLLLIILALLIGCLAFVSTMGRLDGGTTGGSASQGTPVPALSDNGQSLQGEASPKSDEEILEELKKQQVFVTDSISSSAVFQSGSKGSKGNFTVENLKGNNVIEQVEIYLTGGDQLIGKTTPIYPDEHVETIELLESLDKGDHEALAYINYYNPDTKALLGKTAYKITVQVN